MVVCARLFDGTLKEIEIDPRNYYANNLINRGVSEIYVWLDNIIQALSPGDFGRYLKVLSILSK